MLNINENLWRDSSATASKPPPNAWGTNNDPMQAISAAAASRRGQFTASASNVDGVNGGTTIVTNATGVVPPTGGSHGGLPPGGPASAPLTTSSASDSRLRLMFSAEGMAENLLYGVGPPPQQKMAGIENAMDRLNMVSRSGFRIQLYLIIRFFKNIPKQFIAVL
jgi:hypothetical protein